MRNTDRLVTTGAAIGLPMALAVAGLFADVSYQVEPYDPVVVSTCLGVLGSVALVAGYVPAYRASRVDPVAALRAD